MAVRERLLLVGLLTGLLLAPVGGLAPAGAAPASTEQVEHPDTDNTITRIEVDGDGSARWTLTVRTRLETNESVQAFEAFQARFRGNRSQYLGTFRQSMRGIVATASSEVDRPMNATNFTASTTTQSVPRRWGIVSYEFTWEGFAPTDGDAVAVGDVFQRGFFIAENDTFQIVAPASYSVESVSPKPDEQANGTVSWHGRVDFADAQPAVRFEPAASGTTAGSSTAGSLPWLPIVVAVALPLVGGGGYLMLRRRRAAEAASAGDASEASAAGSVESVAPLAPDQRVLELLEANDGQMKQAAIVDEVEWSKSKVSRVVSQLHDEGRIEKTPLGRENLVSLPEE